MSKIEKLRKKPVEVETMVWDGTAEAAAHIDAWVGARPVDVSTIRDLPRRVIIAGEHAFQAPTEMYAMARLWVAHNHSWSPLPVGYRVAKELDGSGFYPLSPAGAAAGYEPTGHKAPDGAPWYAHLDGPCGPECAGPTGDGPADDA